MKQTKTRKPRTRLKPIEYTVLMRFYSILDKCYQLTGKQALFIPQRTIILLPYYDSCNLIQIAVRSSFENVLFVCLVITWAVR